MLFRTNSSVNVRRLNVDIDSNGVIMMQINGLRQSQTCGLAVQEQYLLNRIEQILITFCAKFGEDVESLTVWGYITFCVIGAKLRTPQGVTERDFMSRAPATVMVSNAPGQVNLTWPVTIICQETRSMLDNDCMPEEEQPFGFCYCDHCQQIESSWSSLTQHGCIDSIESGVINMQGQLIGTNYWSDDDHVWVKAPIKPRSIGMDQSVATLPAPAKRSWPTVPLHGYNPDKESLIGPEALPLEEIEERERSEREHAKGAKLRSVIEDEDLHDDEGPRKGETLLQYRRRSDPAGTVLISGKCRVHSGNYDWWREILNLHKRFGCTDAAQRLLGTRIQPVVCCRLCFAVTNSAAHVCRESTNPEIECSICNRVCDQAHLRSKEHLMRVSHLLAN